MKAPRMPSNKAVDASARKAEIDRHGYALYQPSPRLRLAGALTPAEIQLVEEAGK